MRQLLLLLALSCFCMGQTVRTTPSMEGNNTFSGTNTFNGGLTSTTGTFSGAVTAASEQNTGGLGSLASPQTVTASTISNPALSIRRTDNSVPVSGAGLINGWLAPMVRFDLTTSSGGVTGSHSALLVNMPSVKGKTWTTTTQGITANVSAQSVSVVDSSSFTVGETATIDLGQSVAETVTVTAIADATHVSAVFANNHTNGATFGAGAGGKGTKTAVGISITDQAGNTNEINALNPNCTFVATGSVQDPCTEIDVTTTAVSGNYFGDRTGPATAALTLINAGANNTTFGEWIGTTNGSTNFRTALDITSGSSYGVVVENGGGGSPANGIAIASSGTNGLIIGSNQTSPTNPAFTLADPTDGIFLTSRGTGATASSNTMAFQERQASANHVGRFQLTSTQLLYSYDGAAIHTAFDSDGGFTNDSTFRLRNGGTTGSTIASLTNQAGTPVLGMQGGVITFTTGAASGIIRMASAGSVNFRNNANSGDVNGLSKNASDVVAVGGAAGVSVSGPVAGATTYGTATNCSSAGGTCAAAPAGSVTIAAAATTVTVATTAVTANSQIFIQEDSSLGTKLAVTCNTTAGRTYTVTTRTAATSFVITASAAPVTNPACLSYFIVN